ncbi:flavoprotein [Kitasatospora sp. NPDC050463]|uniref:flavoprotein n=1 Tax=Kitasatospora sp. NPDC050463 TaxID=3155786 RepID=UPI0033C11BAA
MSTATDPVPAPPPLGVARLLLVGSGSTAAADLPFWGDWLRYAYPGLTVRAVVTRSAERFVTREALAGRFGGGALLDVWPDEATPSARHVELATWAQAIVVYPATFGFLARLALGLADSPALLAAQCTDVPIGVAPALPPGATTAVPYRSHLAALEARPNVVVGAPVLARSQTTGRPGAWAPLPLHRLLALVEARRVLLAGEGGNGEGNDRQAEDRTVHGDDAAGDGPPARGANHAH